MDSEIRLLERAVAVGDPLAPERLRRALHRAGRLNLALVQRSVTERVAPVLRHGNAGVGNATLADVATTVLDAESSGSGWAVARREKTVVLVVLSGLSATVGSEHSSSQTPFDAWPELAAPPSRWCLNAWAFACYRGWPDRVRLPREVLGWWGSRILGREAECPESVVELALGERPADTTFRTWRRVNGMSLEAAARLSGVSATRLSRLERGLDPLTPDDLSRLMKLGYLGVGEFWR